MAADKTSGLPTFEQVSSVLRYEEETGCVVRLKTGKLAGKSSHRGYRKVLILGKMYYCHRVAWLLHYGYWPNGQLDHIDCDTSNNRISNLRIATQAMNNANQRRRLNNTSGVKGVSFHRRAGKWEAKIKVGGKSLHLGSFDTIEQAASAREAAAKIHFGEFARL